MEFFVVAFHVPLSRGEGNKAILDVELFRKRLVGLGRVTKGKTHKKNT